MIAAHVAGVAGLDVGDQAVHVGFAAMGLGILEAAFGADMDAGGDEDLGIGVRRDHGADVAPVEDGAARLGGEVALALGQAVQGQSRVPLGTLLAIATLPGWIVRGLI